MTNGLDLLPSADLLLVEDRVWIVTARTGVPSYDFAFERFFRCTRPRERPERLRAVGRMGAPLVYLELIRCFAEEGIELLHTPEEHERCATLAGWYPLLTDITPRSVILTEARDVKEVESLGWPLFMKGNRQTARHQLELSVIENAEQFKRALSAYRQDDVLAWQPIVCREFVPLRPVGSQSRESIPTSFEFRTFWWNGRLVGDGPYWQSVAYGWRGSERRAGLEIAEEAARRVNVPFLVVDVAQDIGGRWIVIECNDGQESGYAGASAIGIWSGVVSL